MTVNRCKPTTRRANDLQTQNTTTRYTNLRKRTDVTICEFPHSRNLSMCSTKRQHDVKQSRSHHLVKVGNTLKEGGAPGKRLFSALRLTELGRPVHASSFHSLNIAETGRDIVDTDDCQYFCLIPPEQDSFPFKTGT